MADTQHIKEVHRRPADGRLHRVGGPAVVWHDGSEFWCQNGVLHRTDGPAIIYADGRRYWYRDGKEAPRA